MILTKDKDDLRLIERFFERELTEDELTQFRERLEKDNGFAEQVAQFDYARKEVEKIYYPNEKKNFKKKWQKVLQTPLHQSGTKRSIIYYLTRVAAVLILAIGLIAIGRYMGTQESNLQQLALQNWQKTKIDMSKGLSRGDLIDPATISDKAEKSYQDGKYEETLNLLSVFGDEPDALFWRAKCHFELRQIPKAISNFEAVIQHEESGKKDLALWYQALAYLYESNTNAARKNLNLIIEGKYPKANEAKQLLKQLE